MPLFPTSSDPTQQRMAAVMVVLLGCPLSLLFAYWYFDIGRSTAAHQAEYLQRAVRTEAVVTGFKTHHWKVGRGPTRETVIVQVRFDHEGRILDTGLDGMEPPAPPQREALVGRRFDIVHVPGWPHSARWAPTLGALDDGSSSRNTGFLFIAIAVACAGWGRSLWRSA